MSTKPLINDLTIEEIEEDYTNHFQFSIFNDDTKERLRLFLDSLSPLDRRLFLIYTETGSLRDTAQKMALNLSYSSIYKKIIQIRNKFFEL